MESCGTPGKVQISNSTFLLVNSQFRCIPRGAINIKGFAEPQITFFLIPSDSVAPALMNEIAGSGADRPMKPSDVELIRDRLRARQSRFISFDA